jgi:hypothetical protein
MSENKHQIIPSLLTALQAKQLSTDAERKDLIKLELKDLFQRVDGLLLDNNINKIKLHPAANRRKLLEIKLSMKKAEAFAFALDDEVDEEKEVLRKMDAELKQQVQIYINSFRNNICKYMRGDIGQQFNVVSFSKGVMVNFTLEPGISNSDIFLGETDTIEHAMEILNKKPEDYDFDKEEFSRFKKSFSENSKSLGKSMIILGDSNLIFNGKDVSCWTEERALADVDRLLEYVEIRRRELKQKPK